MKLHRGNCDYKAWLIDVKSKVTVHVDEDEAREYYEAGESSNTFAYVIEPQDHDPKRGG